MPRHALKSLLVLFAVSVAMLAGASAAGAVVVNMGTGKVGVDLVPGTDASKTGLPVVTGSGTCTDPSLTPDLVLRPTGLCWHGGAVIHQNETFALTWDPGRSYWSGTRNYVETFLRDVADSTGTLASPYAVTQQYTDQLTVTSQGPEAPSRAENSSLFGGGCIDYGGTGGATCKFNDAVASGQGNDYPVGDCSVKSANASLGANGAPCITDADIQKQLRTTIQEMCLKDHVQTGFSPLLVMLTPPDVEVCVDAGGKLCSVNAAPKQTPKAEFCNYHSQIQVDGTAYSYVVLPWTAWTGCDEPQLPQQTDLAVDAGTRLVSPLSAGEIAAITNPGLDGWYGLDGNEIDDNAITDNGIYASNCVPRGTKADKVTLGSSGQNPYYLQPESNNAGAIETDPYAPPCALGVTLAPRFVVPSPISQGDVVAFDGSVTTSALMVPKLSYHWNFGDGHTAIGPSVIYTYAKGGDYNVTLTVNDRGGNQSSVTEQVQVLGPDGKPVPPSTPTSAGLHARLALLPQSLKGMLRSGVEANLSVNEVAAGIATLSISRRDAGRAHIRHGRGSTVVIARGTVPQIHNGIVGLRLHLSQSVANKLRRLSHVTLTVRLSLVDVNRHRLTIDAAGRY